MMMIITILKVPVAPAGAFATSGGGGGKPKIFRLIWVKYPRYGTSLGKNYVENLQSWSTLVVMNSSPSGDKAAKVISAGSFFLKNILNYGAKKFFARLIYTRTCVQEFRSAQKEAFRNSTVREVGPISIQYSQNIISNYPKIDSLPYFVNEFVTSSLC